MKIDNFELLWLGHSAFVIKSAKVIYIDPFEIESQGDADMILITHAHYDHCSIADIQKVARPGTIIVLPPDCQSKINGKVADIFMEVMNPGQVKVIDGVRIETIPAYNTDKHFHPKENGWLGYILDVGMKRIYHAGDTDYIPEMDNLRVDIALMPVSGTYVMTAEQAASAVNRFKPGLAIPMHYASIVGQVQDAERFKHLSKVNVEILKNA